MRTIGALRAPAPASGVVKRLADSVLEAAAENPDHSQVGRAAAAAELRARGLSPRPWRLGVPGFVRAADLARGERLFFGWGRAVRTWSGMLVYIPLVGVLLAATIVEATKTNLIVMSDDLYGVLGASVLIPLLTWLIASAFRRKPARVLLLRKFNVRALAGPLERMMAAELRPYGHIASLSDKHIRHDRFGWLSTAMLSFSNPLAAIWFVIGAPVRLIWRWFDRSRMGPALVLNARDYRNLARRLRDRIGLNLQVAFSERESFLIRTSDAWWRLVVRLLIDSADVIVVDLSQVSEGTAWELDAIRSENAGARCVFTALADKDEAAARALASWGFANPRHLYAPDGHMRDRASFRAAMAGAMGATHAPA